MWWIMLSLFVLAAPVHAAPVQRHLLAWTYTPQTADQRFAVQRCVNAPAGCPLSVVATVPLTQREYLDATSQKHTHYCYRVQAVGSATLSNMVCTP